MYYSLVSAVGQNDDNSGTGSFCSVRIRNRGRGATNREAIQSGYVLHEIWRAGSGLTKICYYNCARSEGAMTATTYESLDATLAVEPKQSIWTKGKFTVAAVGKI